MNILVVNPNTTHDFTDRIRNTVQKYAAPETRFDVINPASGPRSIESNYDALLSAQGTLEAVLGLKDQYDAFLMACYGDLPVIAAVREVVNQPVLGIAEASVHMACMLGRRFSIVTSANSWIPLLKDAVERFGLNNRCASIKAVGLPVLACEGSGQEAYTAAVKKLAQDAIDRDGAEVICLGTAGMTGMDKILEAVLGIPVLDGIVCALKFLEGMNAYCLHTSKLGAYAYPHRKELVNMPSIFNSPYINS